VAGQVQKSLTEPGRNISAPELKITAANNAIFQLPTPGRSGRNPPPPPPSEPPTPTANMHGAPFGMPPPPAAPPTAPPSMPPAVPGAASSSATAVAVAPHVPAPANAPLANAPKMPEAQASKGNYREWLQARGQQAMNRSLNNGPNGQSPTASPCPASPLATTVSGSYPGMSHPVPCSSPLPPMPSMGSHRAPVQQSHSRLLLCKTGACRVPKCSSSSSHGIRSLSCLLSRARLHQ